MYWLFYIQLVFSIVLLPMLLLHRNRVTISNFPHEKNTILVYTTRLEVKKAGYSQRKSPKNQTVHRHLTLCETHGLQLKHGEQLLPGVHNLTLHTRIRVKQNNCY